MVDNFIEMLRQAGYARPRIKILPTLQLGAEETRTHGYRESERVTGQMLADFDTSQLICEHSRIVTDRGVAVCPILIEAGDAHLGETLAGSLVDFDISHGACFTCYQYGSICANPSAGVGKEQRLVS